jgi:hypothetical protein
MAKIYQAQNTLLISIDSNDQLGQINLRNFILIISRRMKLPIPNIIIDLKGIPHADAQTLITLRKMHLLAKINHWQMSIFNANSKMMELMAHNAN